MKLLLNVLKGPLAYQIKTTSTTVNIVLWSIFFTCSIVMYTVLSFASSIPFVFVYVSIIMRINIYSILFL